MSVPTEVRLQAIRGAEEWFLRHGLPYFVESERMVVKRGLSRARLLPVVATALLPGGVAGVGTGLLTTLSLGLLAVCSWPAWCSPSTPPRRCACG